MKLERTKYEAAELADFFEEGCAALGALCSRPWHDRLEVLAQGPAAAVVGGRDGALRSAEIWFGPAEAPAGRARDPETEVFPGCPLIFRLTEALRGGPLPLERRTLPPPLGARAPDAAVAERLWRAQYPGTARWALEGGFRPATHVSLVAAVRCEIQAIDQHWSLHRIALSLADGARDEGLARDFALARPAGAAEGAPWPAPDPDRWAEWLRRGVEAAADADLAGIRRRQQEALQRECDRIDRYFDDYARELSRRAERGRSEAGRARFEERLAAARAEQARHRADQAARHEISVFPHVDALALVAEEAWRGRVRANQSDRSVQDGEAVFLPRCRRWIRSGAAEDASGT